MVQPCVRDLKYAEYLYQQGELKLAGEACESCLQEVNRYLCNWIMPFFRKLRCEASDLLAHIRCDQGRFQEALYLMIDAAESMTVLSLDWLGLNPHTPVQLTPDHIKRLRVSWRDPIDAARKARMMKLQEQGFEAGLYFHDWEEQFNSRLKFVSEMQARCGKVEAAAAWGRAASETVGQNVKKETPDDVYDRWINESATPIQYSKASKNWF
jgi:hypothetical protein